MDLRGASAVVTGGGSGLGAATAEALAAAGARVVVLDLNGEAAQAVAARIGGIAVAGDVAAEAPVAEAVAKAGRPARCAWRSPAPASPRRPASPGGRGRTTWPCSSGWCA
jgi:NAD(P)-dependent dehydrogenase (short-subunit alcohol dehydrogenase family)